MGKPFIPRCSKRVDQLFIKTWTNLDNGLEPTVAAPVPSPCKNNIDQKFDRVWYFIKFLYHSFHRVGRAPRAASARAATCTATNGGEPLASARAGRYRVATTEATPRHSRPGTGAWMTCTRCARPRRACTRLAVPRRTPTCRDIPEATRRCAGEAATWNPIWQRNQTVRGNHADSRPKDVSSKACMVTYRFPSSLKGIGLANETHGKRK